MSGLDSDLVYFCIAAVSLFAFIMIASDIKWNH